MWIFVYLPLFVYLKSLCNERLIMRNFTHKYGYLLVSVFIVLCGIFLYSCAQETTIPDDAFDLGLEEDAVKTDENEITKPPPRPIVQPTTPQQNPIKEKSSGLVRKELKPDGIVKGRKVFLGAQFEITCEKHGKVATAAFTAGREADETTDVIVTRLLCCSECFLDHLRNADISYIEETQTQNQTVVPDTLDQ